TCAVLRRIRPPLRSTLFPYTTLFRSLKTAESMSVVGGSSGDGPSVAEVFRLRESDTTVMTAMASRTDAMTKKKTSSDLRCLNTRSEEHTSELQSRGHLVCRLLLEITK